MEIEEGTMRAYSHELTMFTRRMQPFVWPILVMGFAGCGGGYPIALPLIRAHGTVTLDAEPLEKAVVVFEARDGSFSYAETDSRGLYVLRFDSNEMGVTPGKKTVRISMNRRILGLNSNDEGGPEDAAGGAFPRQPPERVPSRYNTRSDLSVEVKPERTRYDFDLRS
jgi:hypothetical protein